MQVISVAASKGGVGKTTTAANLGGLTAYAGLKTLLIDLDGQPNLSSYFPLDYQARGGTFDLLVHSTTTPDEIISHTNTRAWTSFCPMIRTTSWKPCYCMRPTGGCGCDRCSNACPSTTW